MINVLKARRIKTKLSIVGQILLISQPRWACDSESLSSSSQIIGLHLRPDLCLFMQLRKRGKKDPMCMCVCVFVDHAWPFCTPLLTSHGLKLFHMTTPTAKNAGKYDLAAQKKL